MRARADGHRRQFPDRRVPEPRESRGFYLAIDLAKKNDVDFILGTDPDSDRVGIMVRNKQGEFEPVTGNQTGVLLLDYLIGAMKRAGKLPRMLPRSRLSSRPRWRAPWRRRTASTATTRSRALSSWPRR